MNINREDAQAALADIQQLRRKAQTMTKFWAYYPLMWGLIWIVGYVLTQFSPQSTGWAWLTLITIGFVGSGILGYIQGTMTRPTPGSQESFIWSRISISFGILYAFVILWWLVFQLQGIQIGFLWTSMMMFGIIISAVWFKNWLQLGFGVGVTLMTLVGYYFFPHFFYLWSAIFAGLPLVGLSISYLGRGNTNNGGNQ